MKIVAQRPLYKFPAIFSGCMNDGTQQSIWIPHGFEFYLRGVRLEAGTAHTVKLEVILRRVAWPGDDVDDVQIPALEAPLIVPPMILGRGNGETIHAALQKSEWIHIVNAALFLFIWLLLDEDAASSNL